MAWQDRGQLDGAQIGADFSIVSGMFYFFGRCVSRGSIIIVP